ncbi:hypothetical protein AUK04_00075 [Candidatus Roizmanbacteria bacterium CG2_30_33_16]|uniref:DUF2207 domain-containing protein n=4 Tax=Candidatus Roizmaniibacteriota TaxID=1752723 RepID=A0A1J5HNA1_9BACT|nr:MAG: hypothetical protein AUK04_00075 [Candidatus Roizmanbacteria bacterium CG2_30_33_16]
MKRLSTIIFVLFFLLSPKITHAEQINDFNAKIQVNKNGSIIVEEKIVYNFGDLQKHGIFRDIPVIKTNKEGKKFKLETNVIGVRDANNEPYDFTTNRQKNTIQIKIGSASKYVTGIVTYIISYDISGALTYYSDHDELYWNITGNGWQVPILKATAEVVLPEQITASDIKSICFTGSVGSTDQNCNSTNQTNTVLVNSNLPLSATQGLTAVVSFPKNIVAVVEPKEYVDFFDTFLGKLLIFVFGILLLFWYVLYPIWLPIKWYLYGRDPKVETGVVRAWYDPPQTKDKRLFTPGETGTVVDESVDLRDILATVVDLARRGFIRIEEKKKGDFYLIKLKKFVTDNSLPRNQKAPSVNPEMNGELPRSDHQNAPSASSGLRGLQEYEKKLLQGIFESEIEVRLKDQELYETVEDVKKTLYQSLITNGSFPDDPQRKRTFYNVIAGMALFTGNLFLVLMALIFGRVMFKKTRLGREQANVAKSLYNFISSQTRQLEFQANKQMFFEKLLPFAVAFGVEKVWAKRFSNLKLTPPDWYRGYGNNTFTTAYFISSLNSSLNSFSSVSQPPTPTTSTSGFSSGFSGGSSGGGGGGGGGGSW